MLLARNIPGVSTLNDPPKRTMRRKAVSQACYILNHRATMGAIPAAEPKAQRRYTEGSLFTPIAISPRLKITRVRTNTVFNLIETIGHFLIVTWKAPTLQKLPKLQPALVASSAKTHSPIIRNRQRRTFLFGRRYPILQEDFFPCTSASLGTGLYLVGAVLSEYFFVVVFVKRERWGYWKSPSIRGPRRRNAESLCGGVQS